MCKEINLESFKKDKREKLENKAYEQFGIIKAGDDLYLEPECRFVSCSKEVENLMNNELQMKTNQLIEQAVIDTIREMVTAENESISIMVHKFKDDDGIVFEIFNLTNEKRFLLETPMKFDEEHRRIFTGIIASAINVPNVTVNFFMKLTYEELEETIY